MKIKFILPMFIAMFAALVSCSDDEEPSLLSEIQVSSSYIAIPQDGGSCEITVNASDAWTLEGAPEWLTVSETVGVAGESVVTFSADAAVDGRSATLKLNCAGKTQLLNVLQGLPVISDATCAEVNAGPDSKTYRVTGVVTAITNTTYGNFYVKDATGELYIYGTVDATGSYNWSSFNIEVGDEVTVQGPKTTYNGTVELVDVSVINVNKSLIKVESTQVVGAEEGVTELPLEGGELAVTLTCKGDGISVNIPADVQSWLSVVKVDQTNGVVVLKAAQNEKGDRSTKITFTTSDGSKEYSAEAEVVQKGAIIDASIAEFNAAEVGETMYRITGVVSSVYNAAKGRFYVKDWSGETYVYNMSDFESLGVEEGDVVTLVGKRDQWGETIEMVSATLQEKKDVTKVTVAEFLAADESKDVYYMLEGTIESLTNTTWGNFNLNDGTGSVYVYGVYPGWGATGDNRKNFFTNNDVVEGDKITIIGYRTSYDGPQVGGGVVFSFEKAAQ